ncbi:MAG: hypothetical protein NTY90_03205 [Candidatus Micrarchaeota archaeon]|nr:hypothetical protein [Candidatus Micrarchaeota archaeon]
MVKIVCDSSSLISLADTCNIDALAFLKQKAGAEFVITPGVREEIIGAPMKIKALEYSAIRIRKALEESAIAVADAPNLAAKTSEILGAANRLYLVGGKPLPVLHEGEAQSLALLSIARANALLVDEKTTRLIVEDPAKLKEMIEGEYVEKLALDLEAHKKFLALIPPTAIMRSAEVLALAAHRGYFKTFGKHEEEAFHASVYALRAAGCSLAQDELEQYGEISIE